MMEAEQIFVDYFRRVLQAGKAWTPTVDRWIRGTISIIDADLRCIVKYRGIMLSMLVILCHPEKFCFVCLQLSLSFRLYCLLEWHNLHCNLFRLLIWTNKSTGTSEEVCQYDSWRYENAWQPAETCDSGMQLQKGRGLCGMKSVAI